MSSPEPDRAPDSGEQRAIDPIWEKWPDESNAAYVAFRTYLDMGDARTTTGAYRKGTGRKHAEVASSHWREWQVRFKWPERADAYDRMQRMSELKMRAEIQRDTTVQWAERRQSTREKAFQIGQSLMEKAEQMLRFPLATAETIKETLPDGTVKTVTIVEPARWNFGTVARYVLVANQLMRLASELETGRQRVDLRLIREEAEALAQQLGVDPDEMILKAEQIAANAWGEDLANDD